MRQLENRKPNLTPAKRSPAVSVNLHRKFSRAIGGHFLAIRINSIGARSVGLRRSEIDGYFCSHLCPRDVARLCGDQFL